MRILMSCLPSYGHGVPVVAAGQVLTAAGHEVLVATEAGFHDACRRGGLAAAAAGPTYDSFGRLGLASRFPPDLAVRADLAYLGLLAGPVAAAKLDGLARLAHDFKPDLIWATSTDFAAAGFASVAQLPLVSVGVGPMAGASALTVVQDVALAMWPSRWQSGDLYGSLAGYIDMWPTQPGPSRPMPARVQAQPNHNPLAPPAGHEGPRLDRLKPRLLITLGTSGYFASAARLARLLRQLVDLSVEITVVTGPIDPQEVKRQVPGVADAHVAFASYVDLSAHLERTDLLICQAGAGTVLAALLSGCPMILIPSGADQDLIANWCVEAGVCLRMTPLDEQGGRLRSFTQEALDVRRALQSAVKVYSEELRHRQPFKDVCVGVLGGCVT